jgi:hypothetical protein
MLLKCFAASVGFNSYHTLNIRSFFKASAKVIHQHRTAGASTVPHTLHRHVPVFTQEKDGKNILRLTVQTFPQI